jgi:hypothetical protein
MFSPLSMSGAKNHTDLIFSSFLEILVRVLRLLLNELTNEHHTKSTPPTRENLASTASI